MKKSAVFLYVCLFFVFAVPGCNTSVKEIEEFVVDSLKYEIVYNEKKYGVCENESANCATINISYPQFFVEEQDSIVKQINKFIMDFILYYSFGEDKAEDVESLIQQYINNYKDFLSNYPDYNIGWMERKDVSILLNKQGVLSLKLFDFGFMGGAHPNTSIAFENFDLHTGKSIELTNLFKKGYENSLLRIAEREFQKARNLPEHADYNSLGFWFDNNSFSLTDNFSISDTALIFLYNSYEIAPYALGQTEIKIPYDRLKQMIKEEGPLFNLVAHK